MNNTEQLRADLEAARANEAAITGALETARRKLAEASDHEAMIGNLERIGATTSKEVAAARKATEDAAALLNRFEEGRAKIVGEAARLEGAIVEAEIEVHLEKQNRIRAEYREAVANLIATAAAFEQANARVAELFRRAEREIPVSIHGASGRTVAQGAGLSPVWDSNYLRTVPRSLENPQENGRDAIFAEAFRFDPSLLAETDPVRIRAEAHRKFDRELAERADSERLARQKFMEERGAASVSRY